MLRAELALALALGVALGPGRASAQACVLVVLDAPAGSVEAERLHVRLAQVGGACVVENGEHAGVVRIEVRGVRVRVHVDVPGRELAERAVTLPDDPGERAETIAILAGNLLRDESAELLALLVPLEAPGATELPVAEPAASVEPTVLSAEAPPIDPPEATPIDPPEAAPIDPPHELAEPPAELDAGEAPPFLRLGLGGELGTVPQGDGFELDGFAGAEVAWTAPEWIALGVRGLYAGGTRAGGVHVDATPFVELGGTHGIVSGYGQLGAQLQLRLDGSTSFEVAPLVTGGARLRVADVVSIGLETTLRLVVTSRFASLAHELPRGVLPWTFGLTVLFHVS